MSRGHIIPPDISLKFRLWQSMAEAYQDLGKLPPVKRERLLKSAYDTIALIETRKAA